MTHVNKKLVHEYVKKWFNSKFNQNWVNTNDWENYVFSLIFEYYADNEFDIGWTNRQIDKLNSLIKNDPLYVKNYKQWWLKNSLNKMKTDF